MQGRILVFRRRNQCRAAGDAGSGTGTWTWSTSDTTVFQITPNGASATFKILKAGSATITAKYESDTTIDTETLTSVYGLYNVNKKLKLYYGDKTDGLVIKSEYSKGSTISFTIPCISRGQNV